MEKNGFAILRTLGLMCGESETAEVLQDMVLELLQFRESLAAYKPIVNDLIREVGLYPFLEPEELSFFDRVAFEFHKPESMEGMEMVFHRPQARVYRELMSGRSVVLSAPTSFGKSLIIDAIVASEKFKNILVIVPTIALIDETRRRLHRFSARYKINTHPSQKWLEQNIFVLTQERALEMPDLKKIDFFVIDEFYKLSMDREGKDRAGLLNQAFYKLTKNEKQFYMLGPSIQSMTEGAQEKIAFTFIRETYKTVVSEIHDCRGVKNQLEELVSLCLRLSTPTLIFCRSPGRAAAIAKALLEAGVGRAQPKLSGAASWIRANYHADWSFAKALENGIGLHHGRIPRALGQYVVRSFDAENLKILVCTSTLIEGVNTKAQNIIIFDNSIDKKKYDFFTFNNIRGRSGRMFKHFVGNVFLFHEPPVENLPEIDIPALTQSDAAPPTLLIQMDDDDLSPSSLSKVRRYKEAASISYSTLKQNAGIDPEQQIKFADILEGECMLLHSRMSWSGYPTWNELEVTCELMWTCFDCRNLGSGSVRSASQLAVLISKLRHSPSASVLISEKIAYNPDVDKAVGDVLDFLRLWAGYHFPRLLRAMNNIQREIFIRHGMKPGDYTVFASKVEHLFLDSALTALDEYGLPLEIARKLENDISASDNLDDTLQKLKHLDVSQYPLSLFEQELIKDCQKFIG